jgi:ribosomal RNA-processing protein 9
MSGSADRTIKLWSVEDRSYIDTLHGHQSEVIAIDCLRQERILSAGRDRNLRVWKVPEESSLVFRGHQAHIESCCFITNGEFLSGSDDGAVALWSTLKKKPVFIAHGAHGHHLNGGTVDREQPTEQSSALALSNGNENGDIEEKSASGVGAAESWVGAVAVCRASDLAASGAGDGSVQLWALEDTNRVLKPLHKLPVKGFVNSLAFAHSGRFLLAGTGQEPRMGKWGRHQGARNGVIMHRIELS